jgi:hypothetical protein
LGRFCRTSQLSHLPYREIRWRRFVNWNLDAQINFLAFAFALSTAALDNIQLVSIPFVFGTASNGLANIFPFLRLAFFSLVLANRAQASAISFRLRPCRWDRA